MGDGRDQPCEEVSGEGIWWRRHVVGGSTKCIIYVGYKDKNV